MSDASVSQGTPRIASTLEAKGKAQNSFFPLEPSDRALPCLHLDFKFLVSRNEKEINFNVLSCPSYGTLPQQPCKLIRKSSV